MIFNENFFFCKEFIDGRATLDEEESFHLFKVLRLSEGDEIFVTNGKGFLYLCQIDKIIKETVHLSIKNTMSVNNEEVPVISIAIAYSKKSVLEKVVEQCAQLPIKSIIPMTTIHGTHTALSENEKRRLLEKLKTATKQSKRLFITELQEDKPFTKILSEAAEYDYSAIFEKEENCETCLYNQTRIAAAKSLLLLIGPEGGFSVQEIEMAKKAGLPVCTLTSTRLRAETAALAAAIQTLTIRDFHQ